MLTGMLGHRLREVVSLHILPSSSIDYANAKLGLVSRASATPEQAKEFGELLEASRVVWGTCQAGGEYSIRLRVMNPATGYSSESLVATSSNCFQAVELITDAVLREVGLNESLARTQSSRWPFTASITALELLSRAYAGQQTGEPTVEVERKLRQATAIDPEFAVAQQFLARLLTYDQRLEEARERAKQAARSEPECAAVHSTLGTLYLAEGMRRLAESELRRAIELEPDWPDAYILLSDLQQSERKWQDAITTLKSIEDLAPFESAVRMKLASCYVHIGDYSNSVQELSFVENVPSNDASMEYYLGEGYRLAKDTHKALDHFRHFLESEAGKRGESQLVQQARIKQQIIVEQVTPRFVPGEAPQALTRDDLDRVLSERVTARERQDFVDPLSCTREMHGWAENLTRGATNSMEKARKLFEGLRRRVGVGNNVSTRTAKQVFEQWQNTKERFVCRDYAMLYTALARAVGLDSYYVLVDQNYRDEQVAHACSAVFIDGKPLLVDLTFEWFGVAHKQYEFESDPRVCAIYLATSGDGAKEDLALKLAPDWARVHFWVSIFRAFRAELTQSRLALRSALAIESDSALAYYAQGILSAAEQDWRRAEILLKKACGAAQEYGESRYILGTVLLQQGKLKESRDEYRAYLNGRVQLRHEAEARSAICRINQEIGANN